MKKTRRAFHPMKNWTLAMVSGIIGLVATTQTTSVEAAEGLGGPPHIGTFEGSTTFMTTSRNGINPGLYLEVMDAEGNYTEYTSEDGTITIQGTKEGAYITQAKLLGKTKYVDQTTGEILDTWEEGRDLKLESVEEPGLTTVGKNLFDSNTKITTGYGINTGNGEPYRQSAHSYTGFLRIKPNTTYTVRQNHSDSWAFAYDENKKYIGLIKSNIKNNTNFTTPGNAYYVRLDFLSTDTLEIIDGFCIEEGSTSTGYKPYQSNHLTVHENVTLRGINKETRDTLDLITGEVIQNINELVLAGGEPEWFKSSSIANDGGHRYAIRLNDGILKYNASIISNKFPQSTEGVKTGFVNYTLVDDATTAALYFTSSLPTLNDWKAWLAQNNVKVHYQLAENAIKTVGLNSTYYFQPILNREVRVDGIILPLVASVTIPTDPLTFIIDPNQAEGQQFVAPDFSITNNTPASISLNLKAFEQTTNVLNDVLPEAHENWQRLNKAQSKDIALALVPKPSEGWLSLIEGPRYVADDSNYQLGEVDAESTVEFTFSALHGRAIIERLAPQYRLAFEFGF